jgi:high-affinity nickel permease
MAIAGALFSCAVLGLQHGIDVDHVAAVSDVTSVQRTPLEATRCGLLYAAGHAVTVGILGIAIILLQGSMPAAVSAWMERVVGLTLVMLGCYVFGALFRGIGPMGRGQAILAIVGRISGGSGEARTVGTPGYGPKSSLSLGVLHGIGAETPTQLSVLLIASNLGGLQNGIICLTMFAVGMFASNMVLTTAATSVFAVSKARPVMFRALGALTASYSIWIGTRLMIG